MTKLDGKIAIITGGNSGIGLATAQRFVAEGAYVFIFGRRQSELDAAARTIGKNVTAVRGDVSNLADLDKLYAVVKEQKGRIDVLFANAGVGEFAALAAITEEHFDKTFDINVKGLLFTVQKALPLIRNGGSIILTASTAASKGIEGFSVYSATKAAVRSFARSWTVDLKQRKIRVNAISPGPIDTLASRQSLSGLVQSEQQSEQLRKKLVTAVPLGRMGSPDEVAKVASFLASDESSYVTGIEFFVDGGSPDDYSVEVASGAWFGSLIWPGAVGLLFGGPVGLAAGVAVGGIMAYEFEKHVWEKVLEVVKKESAVQPTIDSVKHYHD